MFLDRDGTLNVRPPVHDYLTSASQFVWLPDTREALARLHRVGYVLAVVSNQRGVARGLVSQRVQRDIEQAMLRDLEPYGCTIAAFRYCVHAEEDACACRKPRPGMLLDLADELDIDLAGSWMVGDCASDVHAGRAAGCRTALLGDRQTSVEPDVVVPTLAELSALVTPSS